ncbi:hypothetical protein HK104_007727 [Borealophlyctis nickersoniae]|nr:hypothetical protein HK104_007727 [Borealophlyctis nickersoniae]
MATRTEQVLNRKASLDRAKNEAALADLDRKERSGHAIHEQHMQEVSAHAASTNARFNTGENLARKEHQDTAKRAEVEADIEKKAREGPERKARELEKVKEKARSLDAPL